MTRTDVVVVGGGPGGSSLARALVRSGMDVTVLDRASFPRDKVCAGWITPAVVESLDIDPADYARGRVLQPIHAFRVGVLGGGQIETRRRSEPASWGIRRCEFDEYLLRRTGAHLRLGEPLREMRRERGGSWLVNGDLRAPLVVGAGGHFCPVARWLGAHPGRDEEAVLAQEIEFELSASQAGSCPVDASVPELWFCADLAGYGWVFRKGDWLNVGLGREIGEPLAPHVDSFLRFLVGAGRVPADTPGRFRGHAYRLRSHSPRRILGDGVLLVGDAAGLAYPESGEGIRTAIESGLLAAGVIVQAEGDYGASRLEEYPRALARRFGPASTRMTASDLIPAPLRRTLARGLLSRRWFADRVVIDRWFLHRHQPGL